MESLYSLEKRGYNKILYVANGPKNDYDDINLDNHIKPKRKLIKGETVVIIMANSCPKEHQEYNSIRICKFQYFGYIVLYFRNGKLIEKELKYT